MKKLINIALIAFVAISAVGCYNDFGIPEEAHIYTDSDFTAEGCEIVSIKAFKTAYSHLVGATTDSSTDYNDSEIIAENWVIRGKVISSDESGNIYKSLYIQDNDPNDGLAAIELRLYASNYVKYPIGSMVYVKLKGLSIGDYRGMISVGAHSYQAEASGDTDYIHTTLESRTALSEHIFLGESGEITEDDILVINSSNYSELYTSASENYLACLVRFEGLTSAFTEYGSASWTTYTYPSYFSANTDEGKFDWSPELADVDAVWSNPPMAYKGTNPTIEGSTSSLYYYGSSWFTFNRSSSSHTAQFILRLSGYARFKDDPIPADGSTVNITAIMTQYLSSTGYYTTYQIVPRFQDDIVVVSE